MDDRLRLATTFVDGTAFAGWDMEPLAGDASSRRYFRLRSGGNTAVLMDAPPENGQGVAQFLDVARFLESVDLSVPAVLAEDRPAGFAVLEDFGDRLFAGLAHERPDLEALLYGTATDVLVDLDGCAVPEFVPNFEAGGMAAQTEPVFEWYRRGIKATRGAGFNRLKAELEAALMATELGSPTLLLRDFHSENLMWLPDRNGVRRVGLLDFQDAMAGPAGYDLVSLLLDARRDVTPAIATTVKHRFVRATGYDSIAFEATFAAIGVQRNLRILGVFARLAIEVGKPRYLDFIPRVWQHMVACLSHPSLSEVAEIVAEDLPEPTPGNLRELKKRCRRSHR